MSDSGSSDATDSREPGCLIESRFEWPEVGVVELHLCQLRALHCNFGPEVGCQWFLKGYGPVQVTVGYGWHKILSYPTVL
jgi:hypothetical protein